MQSSSLRTHLFSLFILQGSHESVICEFTVFHICDASGVSFARLPCTTPHTGLLGRIVKLMVSPSPVSEKPSTECEAQHEVPERERKSVVCEKSTRQVFRSTEGPGALYNSYCYGVDLKRLPQVRVSNTCF